MKTAFFPRSQETEQLASFLNHLSTLYDQMEHAYAAVNRISTISVQFVDAIPARHTPTVIELVDGSSKIVMQRRRFPLDHNLIQKMIRNNQMFMHRWQMGNKYVLHSYSVDHWFMAKMSLQWKPPKPVELKLSPVWGQLLKRLKDVFRDQSKRQFPQGGPPLFFVEANIIGVISNPQDLSDEIKFSVDQEVVRWFGDELYGVVMGKALNVTIMEMYTDLLNFGGSFYYEWFYRLGMILNVTFTKTEDTGFWRLEIKVSFH